MYFFAAKSRIFAVSKTDRERHVGDFGGFLRSNFDRKMVKLVPTLCTIDQVFFNTEGRQWLHWAVVHRVGTADSIFGRIQCRRARDFRPRPGGAAVSFFGGKFFAQKSEKKRSKKFLKIRPKIFEKFF